LTLLGSYHVARFQSLVGLRHFKFDVIALIQRPVAFAHDGRKMDKDILASVFMLDKTKAFPIIKPLYNTGCQAELTPNQILANCTLETCMDDRNTKWKSKRCEIMHHFLGHIFVDIVSVFR
jgi:hypothetical protein